MYPARYTQFISYYREEKKTALEKVKEVIDKLTSFEEFVLPDGVSASSYLEVDRIGELKDILGGDVYIKFDKDGYILVKATGSGLLGLKFQLIKEVLGEDCNVVRKIRISRDRIVVEIAIEYDTVDLDYFDHARKIAEKFASAFGMKLRYFYIKGDAFKDLCFVGYK